MNVKWEDELPYWEAAGFDVAEAWAWYLCGYGVPDAIAHRDVGVVPDATLKALRHLGIAQTPQNYKRWKGLNERQIRRAIDRGFKSAKDFRPYEKSPIDADVVRNALVEIDEPVSPELVIRYHELRAGGLDSRQALRWIKYPEIPADFVGVSVANKIGPDEADSWMALELSASDLNGWLQMNPRLDPKSVAAWCSIGVSANMATWFITQMIEEPTLAKRWLSLTDEITTLEEWIQLDSSTPELAKEWFDAKFAPSDAAAWIQVGMNPPQAKRWQKLGKTTSDVAEWASHHFEIEEALTWLNAHPRISALVARRRRDAGVKPI